MPSERAPALCSQRRGNRSYFRRQFMKNGMRRILPRLLVCALLTAGSGVCVAQNTSSGDLRGTATDETGAVVQDVTVKVTDVDRGVTRTYETDRAGLYDTGAIPEGH